MRGKTQKYKLSKMYIGNKGLLQYDTGQFICKVNGLSYNNPRKKKFRISMVHLQMDRIERRYHEKA